MTYTEWRYKNKHIFQPQTSLDTVARYAFVDGVGSMEKENKKIRDSARKLYVALYNCLDKFPCDHEYSAECTACQADMVLNRESYILKLIK